MGRLTHGQLTDTREDTKLAHARFDAQNVPRLNHCEICARARPP